MPVSDVFPSREGRGRHCFVFAKPGDSETWGFHFFERGNKASGQAEAASAPPDGPLLHIALLLPDESSKDALHERLRSHNSKTTVIDELGGNLLFEDNNGVVLEVTWPK